MPRSQGGRFSFPPREGQPSRRLACAGVLAALGALARWSTSNASTTARVPCRFVGGERHCDESKAVPCSRRRRGCFPKLLGSLDRTFGRCSTSVHIMLTPGEPRAMILWCCLLGARRGDAFLLDACSPYRPPPGVRRGRPRHPHRRPGRAAAACVETNDLFALSCSKLARFEGEEQPWASL